MVQHEDTIFAPLFWGFVLSVFLGGMTVVQAYVYFPGKRDRPLIRWTAGLMLAFDLTSSVLISYSVYYYLIPEFGSFDRFKAVTPQFSAECLIAAMITFISQLYFVHQLVVVKRAGKGNWIVIGLITFFAVLAAIGGIGCVSSMYIWDEGVLAQRNKAFTIFFALAKGFNALTDILATTAMCLFLTDQKGGIERTNNLLSQVMLFVIQRGILVTLIQAAVLITFLAAPSNLAWLALHMNVTRLYANTFFAMLNGRSTLREKHAGTIIGSMHTTGRGGGAGAFSVTGRGATRVGDSEEEEERAGGIHLGEHFQKNGPLRSLSDPVGADGQSGWAHEKLPFGSAGRKSGELHGRTSPPFPILTRTVVVTTD